MNTGMKGIDSQPTDTDRAEMSTPAGMAVLDPSGEERASGARGRPGKGDPGCATASPGDGRAKIRRVSIVIPVYNEVNAIADMVERIGVAISNHKNARYEIIVVNDGSTDNTQHVLEQLVRQGKMVKRFEIATPSLNEIFLKVVGEQDEQREG